MAIIVSRKLRYLCEKRSSYNDFSNRPHSTDSATHRKMTLSLADRCSKTQKIRILPMAGRDPESQRTEMIKVLSPSTCLFC